MLLQSESIKGLREINFLKSLFWEGGQSIIKQERGTGSGTYNLERLLFKSLRRGAPFQEIFHSGGKKETTGRAVKKKTITMSIRREEEMLITSKRSRSGSDRGE